MKESGKFEKDGKNNKKELTNQTKYVKIKDAKSKALALKGKPEGTYDLLSGETVSFNTGYQVSFQQSSDTYSDSEYDDKVEELSNKTNSKAYAGVFGGDPEVSFHSTNINEAMDVAQKYNQHSIWDWKRGRIIKNKKYNSKKNKVNRED